MFFRLPRLTPGYLRFLQTQAYQPVSVRPPDERALPGVALLMGTLGIGMCGYSSQQLTLYHRPSARVLQWAGTHTTTPPAAMMGGVSQRTPFLDVSRQANACMEVPPPSFAGEKVPMK
ncbi:hypothetical protein N1851_023141 [Merluccius polli]|uniref:Uncharacterized protein n=1 Tax=Merluccius polli TaxID=89951 RepID=A0AA47NVA7_MERPO|nr:hypothetical protein N1851_023141 [Merluccius polli]